MKKILSIILMFALFTITIPLQAQWVQTYKDGISCFAVSGSNLFAGNSEGVHLSTDNGTSWATINNGLTDTNVRALAVSGTNVYVGTFGVFLSTNNGTNWIKVDNGLPYSDLVYCIEISGMNIFAGTQGSGVYLSTNNGTSWNAINNGLDLAGGYNRILALVVSGANIYAGTDNGIFLSTNNGTNWTLVENYPSFGSFAVSNSYIIAGQYNYGVFLCSPDLPDFWVFAANQGLTSPVYALKVYGTYLFAGTEHGGIFLSTDYGHSWNSVNTSLTEGTSILSFAVSGSYLLAGGTTGAWRRPLSDFGITAVEREKYKLPTDFVLEQNYPNPFNPITTVKFSIPNSQFVTLIVYDMLGREATTLVNEEKLPGNYEVHFNGSHFSSGVYFYRLQSGSFSDTKKFILMK